MAFLYNKPKVATKLFSAGDAISQLAAFNAVYEAGLNTGSVNNCDMSDPDRASWRKGILDGVINVDGAAAEIDFFEKWMGGGKTTAIEATDLYIKYRGQKDYNIVAQSQANGNTPGAATTFTLLKSLHTASGKYSNVAVNGNLFIYDDNQWCVVTAVDKSVDFAHTVTVTPFNPAYTVYVRKGVKMMYNSTRLVDQLSCSVPDSTWETPGYVQKIQPAKFRKDWEVPVDLTRPYQEVMQFALTFDRDGKKVDSWELFEKTKAREELQYMKNLQFFIGQKRENPLLLGGATTTKFGAFMGYIPTLQYGGGTIYDNRASDGFDFDSDGQSVLVRQDQRKESKEYMVLASLQWRLATERRSVGMFKNNTGVCTFESFSRSGANRGDIEKLGIDSYKYMGFTMHIKTVSAWSDKNALGNGIFPYLAIMMPTQGLTDSNGRSVPPIEFFNPGGNMTMHEEFERDHRKLESGCEKYSGSLIEYTMMAVHAPQRHILINPILNA